ncbi:phosphatidylglycerol lysyltransferase domain-containing protein [Allocoleopsis sp.]|uniref:phosphatidylglycerol lysyltransferase domain-containing protein n=1 Tax=Allocoleopsis sp. TaxID=3088169 RepID=UPI002FD39319
MLTRRIQIGVWTAALLTSLVGVVNLLSAVTVSEWARVKWLKGIFPFEVREGGHLFAALTGFFLLMLASNLLRRKRIAWLLTIALLIVSIISHLLKGFDWEESLLSFVLLVQLLLMRNIFTAQSDRPSIAQGFKILIWALLFTLAYGTAGFFLVDLRHYHYNFTLTDALYQTLAMFFTEDNAGLVPRTPYGRFFENSIYLVGGITLSYALFMLLRPVLLRGEPATPEERQRAQDIVEKYGRSSLACLTLLKDKAYYFSPSGRSVIAYVPKGRGAIALGDPIGPDDDRKEVIIAFKQFCQRNDWYPAFYQTLPDDLELYRVLGFRTIKIGEEAIVDLKAFTLQGKAGKDMRAALNRMKKLGHEVKFYQPPISDQLLQQLKPVSDEWLKMTQGSEKQFSLGWFYEDYLRNCEIAVVQAADGQISAFANVIPEYQLNEITIDMMRRRAEVEQGTMDFLFTSMFQHFKERGYDRFNLGLSALSGVGEKPQSPRLEKALHYLYEHLNQFYNFKGLHAFKEKFKPEWEPRFFIYPRRVALPEVVMALIRADSGDRLLDYLKPGE